MFKTGMRNVFYVPSIFQIFIFRVFSTPSEQIFDGGAIWMQKKLYFQILTAKKSDKKHFLQNSEKWKERRIRFISTFYRWI